jgi:membrane protease YdiL (CAAX protease family)
VPARGAHQAVAAFCLLTFLLSLPFWLAGAALKTRMLPGLPISALAAVCPGVAAVILVIRCEGFKAGGRLAARVFNAGRGPRTAWWLALSLTAPFAVNAAALAVQMAERLAVPSPAIGPVSTLALAALFLTSAAFEEIGWTAYALTRLAPSLGTLRSGLLIGAVWALWHYVPLAQAGRSPGWIAWWTLGTIAARVAMTFVSTRTTATVLSAVLFHAMIDLSWQLYPAHGSAYDPALSGSVMAALALALVAITHAAKRRARLP